MARPHIEPYVELDHPYKKFDLGGFKGSHYKVLSLDSDSGACTLKVRYDGAAPWIESRLQDFWGLKKTPSIAGGAVPLVLHLLAPNMRAVQVTQDLAGFWERAYKELRPALSRRYPKHHWPE